jgi:tRNA threonylcarbamoyladenosine biosynthesis protein TsaE
MRQLSLYSSSLSDTDLIGSSLAQHLPDGITVSLNGPLGSGKTRLVQAIAAGCEIPVSLVLSPTFVLCREYEGTRTIAHLDAYRIKDADEFWEIGVEEYFGTTGITLVEWGVRVEGCLPANRINISIAILGNDKRHFQFAAVDSTFERCFLNLKDDCEALLEEIIP